MAGGGNSARCTPAPSSASAWDYCLLFRYSFAITDIEQPLTGRNLIKPTDLFPKQTQDFDLHLIQPFNQVVPLALDGHTDTMNPFEVSDHGVNSLKINGLIF